MRPWLGTAPFVDGLFMGVHATATRASRHAVASRCGREAAPPWVTLALFAAPAHELCFAKVDLALDSAARLVLELAASVELVHAPAFGLDQAELDLIVQLLLRAMIT